jgi:hypothetical protein
MARIENEIINGKEKNMLPEKDVLIDTLDMNFVQNLITAVNESRLDRKIKLELRTTLDRWQNALILADEIRVTF